MAIDIDVVRKRKITSSLGSRRIHSGRLAARAGGRIRRLYSQPDYTGWIRGRVLRECARSRRTVSVFKRLRSSEERMFTSYPPDENVESL